MSYNSCAALQQMQGGTLYSAPAVMLSAQNYSNQHMTGGDAPSCEAAEPTAMSYSCAD